MILDIDLPGIDGHKLCARIKEDQSFGNPYVIAVTGLDDPKEEERIRKEGANAFFHKPVEFDRLLKAVQEVP